MNTFEFKNLVKNLKNSLKQKTFFKDANIPSSPFASYENLKSLKH